jgi:hypothetical protein
VHLSEVEILFVCTGQQGKFGKLNMSICMRLDSDYSYTVVSNIHRGGHKTKNFLETIDDDAFQMIIYCF